MRPQPAEQQRDIRAEAPAVGVHLVEHDEAAAVILEERVAVPRADQQVLEHHVVRQEDVRRALPHRLALGLFRRAVVLLHRDVGVARGVEVLRDADFLIVREGVHRVDEDRRDAALLEFRRVLDRVLQDGKQEALALAGPGAGRHGERTRVFPEQVRDRFTLVEKRPRAAGAALDGLRQPPVERQLAPRRARLERPVRLEERILREEARLVERLLEPQAQLRVARPELGDKEGAILSDRLIDDGDGMDGSHLRPPNFQHCDRIARSGAPRSRVIATGSAVSSHFRSFPRHSLLKSCR